MRATALTAGSSAAAGEPWAEWTESVRVRLLRQREFRVQQLSELDEGRGDALDDPGTREIGEALRVAARGALAAADEALAGRGTHRSSPRSTRRCLDDRRNRWC
jgi:hypothetical protein